MGGQGSVWRVRPFASGFALLFGTKRLLPGRVPPQDGRLEEMENEVKPETAVSARKEAMTGVPGTGANKSRSEARRVYFTTNSRLLFSNAFHGSMPRTI